MRRGIIIIKMRAATRKLFFFSFFFSSLVGGAVTGSREGRWTSMKYCTTVPVLQYYDADRDQKKRF